MDGLNSLIVVFFVSLLVFVEAQNEGNYIQCGQGYTYFQYSCYKYGAASVPFDKAREICQKEGGDLACVTTAEENTFVGNLARGKRSWIGGVRSKPDAVTTTFQWISREPWEFTSWRKREPNNWGGREHCIETNFVRLAWWNDHFCHKEKPYVCEIPAL